jgi:hypothetical protein
MPNRNAERLVYFLLIALMLAALALAAASPSFSLDNQPVYQGF